MEVLRSNYLEVIPEVLKKLEDAAFVSFDAEYTGLKSIDGDTPSLFDTTAERYEILRRVVLNNSAPQFGISIFHRVHDPENPTDQLYTVDAYTFYLMEPSFADFNMVGPKATVEVDCCQFLNYIKFDFNKWILSSAPYLNEVKAKELRNYLKENPDFMEQCKRSRRPLDKVLFPEFKPSLTDDDIEEIVQRLRGFARIVDVLSSKEVLPVVGHNMALDLMYFFNNFCTDLPEKYEDFKSQVVRYLPTLFDTKFMTVKCRKMLDHPALAHSKEDIEKLQCSGLYVMYKATSTVIDKFSPKFRLLESCTYFEEALELGKTRDLEEESEGSLCHQPSFDACVTGIVFLNLSHIACRIHKEFLERKEPPSMEEILLHVNHWREQVFLSRATVMTMCLRGYDPRPNRLWLLVTFDFDDNKYTGEQMMKLLKSDPEISPILAKVDYKSVGFNRILIAVTRSEWRKDLYAKLRAKGIRAENVKIPWDQKRMDEVKGLQKDQCYDSGRNTFFY